MKASNDSSPGALNELEAFVNPNLKRRPTFKITDDDKKIINQHLFKGLNNEFPKKQFIVAGVFKQYCSYLTFTNSLVNMANKQDKVIYTCMLCNTSINDIPSHSRNVKRHLEFYCTNKNMVAAWMKAYNRQLSIKKQELSDNDFLLVKFFISTNTAISQLENEHLSACFKFEVPNRQTFTTNFLPSVLERVQAVINEKLNNAENICLISDIWTNAKMHDFIGIVACVIDSDFKREFLVIGMDLMPGNHCAEHIQEATEKIVNRYEFDYSKIIGNFLLIQIDCFFSLKSIFQACRQMRVALMSDYSSKYT